MLTTRRLLPAVCCAVLLTPGPSFAQAAKSDDAERQVLSAHEALAKAHVTGDQAIMDRLFADGFTHTHSSGGVQEKASFMSDLKTGARRYIKFDMSEMKIRFHGPATAIITGKSKTLTNNTADPTAPPDTFIEVWVLDRGTWRNAAWATTRPPRPAAGARGR